MPCEDKGSNQSDASTSQEAPKIASKPQEATGGAWNGFSLTDCRRNQPCPHLDLGLLASRTMIPKFSVI